MGRLSAESMLEQTDLRTALTWHLKANHYPPVPESMVQPCLDAIDAYWEDDLHANINLPSPIRWRGQNTAPAYAIIEAHHLDAFLETGDGEE